ncbi:pilus assembly protein CpaE [Nocardioides sp.]|uniref:pilus assembly protein CpaE n=1 Tax=Nocardioides sp. TaxID=35761 RepID=UPI003D0BD064
MSLDLARALHASGVRWTPANGDRFMVPDRDLDEVVFVLSDMVIEIRETPTGPLLAFNGTTEWALDSLDADAAVWLPREDQLRDLLGDRFGSLESLGGGSVPSGFAVSVTVAGETQRHVEVDAEAAYARALLAVLGEGQA